MSQTWSIPVRLTHWLVAASVIVNMFNDTGYWHRMIGYACIVLIVLRAWHGLHANTIASSRFYCPSMQAIKQHWHELRSETIQSHHGHNPLGQLAVYVMWLLIVLLGFTGWLSRTDAYWGEDWPVVLHQYLSYALMSMVGLHLVAVAVMSKLQKKNLIKNMIGGKN